MRLHNRGQEVAIYVAGEQDGEFNPGDYFLFYGQNPRSKYTDTNVYWLTWNEGAHGLRMQERHGAPAQVLPVSAGFTRTVHLEAKPAIPQRAGERPGSGSLVLAHPARPGKWGNPHQLPGQPRPGLQPAGSATIKGLFKSFSATPRHHTQVLVNNHLVYDAYWPSLAQHSFSARFPQSYLIEGTNGSRWPSPEMRRSLPIRCSLTGWSWITPAVYTATDDEMPFLGQAGDREYQLDGFSTASLQIFDITTPEQPARITGAMSSRLGEPTRLASSKTWPARGAFWRLAEDRLRTPVKIFEDAASDLHRQCSTAQITS